GPEVRQAGGPARFLQQFVAAGITAVPCPHVPSLSVFRLAQVNISYTYKQVLKVAVSRSVTFRRIDRHHPCKTRPQPPPRSPTCSASRPRASTSCARWWP